MLRTGLERVDPSKLRSLCLEWANDLLRANQEIAINRFENSKLKTHICQVVMPL